MYAKVLKKFNDKDHEGLRRNPGDVYELTKKRFTEINKALPDALEECDKPDDPPLVSTDEATVEPDCSVDEAVAEQDGVDVQADGATTE